MTGKNCPFALCGYSCEFFHLSGLFFSDIMAVYSFVMLLLISSLPCVWLGKEKASKKVVKIPVSSSSSSSGLPAVILPAQRSFEDWCALGREGLVLASLAHGFPTEGLSSTRLALILFELYHPPPAEGLNVQPSSSSSVFNATTSSSSGNLGLPPVSTPCAVLDPLIHAPTSSTVSSVVSVSQAFQVIDSSTYTTVPITSSATSQNEGVDLGTYLAAQVRSSVLSVLPSMLAQLQSSQLGFSQSQPSQLLQQPGSSHLAVPQARKAANSALFCKKFNFERCTFSACSRIHRCFRCNKDHPFVECPQQPHD